MDDRQSQRLSAARIKLFTAILLRNAVVFEELKDSLTVDHFPGESHRLVYRVLLDFYKREERLPKYLELGLDIQSLLERYDDLASDETRDDLTEFIEFAFDKSTFRDYKPTSDKATKLALSIASQLMQSKLQSSVVNQLQSISDLDKLPACFQAAQQQIDKLISIQYRNERTNFFEPDWDKKSPLILSSTGIGFIDKYLGGGSAPGEVYGFMAPFGTCKTTMAVMLMCAAGQQCFEDFLMHQDPDKKGIAVLVSYEAAASPELQHRALMYAAEVRRQSLVKMGEKGLSSLGNDPLQPLDYEKKKFAMHIQNEVFETEFMRVQKCINWLNDHVLVLDFSGRDPRYPQAGYGGINEIRRRIDQELKLRGKNAYVKNVIVDYLSLMVDQDTTLQKDGSQRFEDHKLIASYVKRIGREIGVYFNTHVWLMQQLSGLANSQLSPTKRLTHTDAKGSKSFGENLDFSFVVGALTEDQLGQINCSKHRRHHPMPPSIIKVDGEFNLVLSPDNYHVDNQGKIVDKSISSATGVTNNAPLFYSLDDIDQP
jgi:replicative DNA helicase